MSATWVDEGRDGRAASWLTANALAALITFVIGLAGIGVTKLVGEPLPGSTLAVRLVAAATAIATIGISFVAYAMLTYPVLARILPELSRRTWLIVHLAPGLAIAIFLAASLVVSPEAPAGDPWADLGLSRGEMVGVMAMVGLVGGALVGLIIGAIQAVALRRAASETKSWIRWSVLSGAVSFVVLLVLYVLLGIDPAADGVLTQALSAGAMLLSAIVMVPAVQRLRPLG